MTDEKIDLENIGSEAENYHKLLAGSSDQQDSGEPFNAWEIFFGYDLYWNNKALFRWYLFTYGGIGFWACRRIARAKKEALSKWTKNIDDNLRAIRETLNS